MGAAGAGKGFGSGAIAGGGVDGSAMMVTGAVFGSVGVAIDSGFATLTSGWITYSDEKYAIHNYNILGYISIILVLMCVGMAYRLDRLILKHFDQ